VRSQAAARSSAAAAASHVAAALKSHAEAARSHSGAAHSHSCAAHCHVPAAKSHVAAAASHAAAAESHAAAAASHVAADAESTFDGVRTKVELDDYDCCSDVDSDDDDDDDDSLLSVNSVRECCREFVRENEMLRTQLDALTLQRTPDEERTSRRLEEGAAAVRTELCREILEMLQREFSCSICSEVRRT
jgi:hypothetical protein